MNHVSIEHEPRWGRRRRVTSVIVAVGVIATVLAPLPGTTSAWAGAGSRVSGVVWADTDRDGARDADEPVRSGVTVTLVDATGVPVPGFATTTAANGTYTFADVPDGDYRVRFDAPPAFDFPSAGEPGANGPDNDAIRTTAPTGTEPERGTTTPFTVGGSSQHPGIDGGLQPIATLVVQEMPGDGCEGRLMVDGGVSEALDDNDDPGNDSADDNCRVRTRDTVSQTFGVNLTGLVDDDATVDNVIVELVVHAEQGADIELVPSSTRPDGMPVSCLAAGQGGANPGSQIVRDSPEAGDITILCNIGRMTSNLTDVQVSYRHTGSTAIPSNAHISARAYAAGGDAGASNEVDGPAVEVTGYAEWELTKSYYTDPDVPGGPDYTEVDFGSGLEPGYRVQYQFTIEDMMGGAGGAELDWSTVTFTDVMEAFPGARILDCRSFNLADSPAERSPWQLNCPEGEVQDTDGWQLSITPLERNATNGTNDRLGRMAMTVFIPYAEMHAIVAPDGAVTFDNAARDTDDWKLVGGGGAENHGDGEEPGFDGTGDNLATVDGMALTPQWDLSKALRTNPAFRTMNLDVDGDGDTEDVSGYVFDYRLTVRDLRGPDNIGPWLDGPVTFTDQFLDQYTADPGDLFTGAYLLSCASESFGSPVRSAIDADDLACDTGQQPAEGWDFSFEPNQDGFDRREARIIAQLFIPLDEFPQDPCLFSDVTIDLKNQVINTEHWTAGGEPNNGTGFEPNGWNTQEELDSGLAADGTNNVDTRSIRPSTSDCGTLTGDKRFVATETGGWYEADPFWPRTTYPGNTINSAVNIALSNSRMSIVNPVMCDVFDVSTMYIRDTSWLRMDSYASATAIDVVSRDGGVTWGPFDPADFIIEYAIGPNQVNTQSGAFDTAAGLWPVDSTSNQQAAAGCETSPAASGWRTDPTTFGADWQDRVNMIRVRPADPELTVRGQVRMILESRLQLRSVYNGGPHDGQVMPDRIRITNEGGWSTDSADGWNTVERQRAFTTVRIEVGKTVTPTEYFPGDQVIWNLQLRAYWLPAEPMELTGLRLVDTLPVGLSLDTECTQERLPAGVTVSANLATRQLTFFLPDVTTTGVSSQWIVHPTAADAMRLQLCTTVTDVAQTGDQYTNQVQGFVNEAPDSNIAQATIRIIGPGKLGIAKGVDKPFVASGEQYVWNLDWVNTSTTTTYAAPDIIDVLPWNGDAQEGTGSKRDGYGSVFTGVARLVGPLEQPRYTRGGSGVGDEVAGTWYYTTAASSTLSHDARAAANAAPEAPGGLWLTEAEVSDFARVTGIRFVSAQGIAPQTGVRALLPAVSLTSSLDVWYVNRGSIFTPTSPDSLLLSNQPVVQIPGFSVGDLVWIDRDNDGRFTEGVDTPVSDVDVEVIDENGRVVGSTTTDADGRWSVSAIPAGTYRARIPAREFQPGGTLAPFKVISLGSSDANAENEGTSNNNTPTPRPAETGLTSSPVTLAYVYDGQGDDARLVGANGPIDDDVADLAPPRISADFTNYTIDLALAPSVAVDIEKYTNGVDADEPTGPSIAPGDPVEWTYVVTNTGSIDLFDIVVTDDRVPASEIDCGDGTNVVAGPLAMGEQVTCEAHGVAHAGQYANLGSVSARGPLAVDENGDPLPPEQQDPRVTDEDWSHYYGGTPPTPPGLAWTGVQLTVSLALGVALLLAGGVLVIVRRRREEDARVRS